MSEERALPFIPGWFRDLDLAPAERLILLHVVSRGECWDSIAAIAKAVRMNRKTVQKAIQSLVGKGLLRAFARTGQTTLLIASLKGSDSDEMAFAE